MKKSVEQLEIETSKPQVRAAIASRSIMVSPSLYQGNKPEVWVNILIELERLGWINDLHLDGKKIRGGIVDDRVWRLVSFLQASMEKTADDYDRLGLRQLAAQYRELIVRLVDKERDVPLIRRLHEMRMYAPEGSLLALLNKLKGIERKEPEEQSTKVGQ